MGIGRAINECRTLNEAERRDDADHEEWNRQLNEFVESNDLTAHELLGLLVAYEDHIRKARREAEKWRREALSHRGHYVERQGIIPTPLPWNKETV